MSLDLKGKMSEDELARLHQLLGKFNNALRTLAKNAGHEDALRLVPFLVSVSTVRNAVGDAYAQAVGL